MAEEERYLVEDRALRDEARAVMQGRYARLRGALKDRSVPQRAADVAKAKVRDAGEGAVGVVKESKGIIALTVGALLLWLLRKPLMNWTAQTWPKAKAELRKHLPENWFD